MSSGGGFGPSSAGASGAPPFAVSGPSQVALDASRSGVGSFVVSNVTGRPVRCRAFVTPGAGADAAWFTVVGDAERALPVAGNAIVDVQIGVPEKAPPGAHSFVLAAALEDDPNQVVSGPTVAFLVPERKPDGFPWWIVIVAIVGILLLAGGGYLIYALTRPDPDPPATRGELDVPARDAIVNLETQEIFESTYGKFIPGGDVWFSDADVFLSGVPGPGPLTVSSFTSGIAVVPDGELATCRAAMEPVEGKTPESFVEVPDVSDPTFVCLITGERQYAVLEIAPQEEDVPTRVVGYAVWEGTA